MDLWASCPTSGNRGTEDIFAEEEILNKENKQYYKSLYSRGISKNKTNHCKKNSRSYFRANR